MLAENKMLLAFLRSLTFNFSRMLGDFIAGVTVDLDPPGPNPLADLDPPRSISASGFGPHHKTFLFSNLF